MDVKLFSIVICSYNGSRCLRKTIESILSLKCYKELVQELILINNSSTDSTPDIMQEYELTYENVHMFDEQRLGLSYARLCGVQHATGQWIVYVDDDNYLDSSWLVEAKKTATTREDLGVFGGAIVPYIGFEMSKENEVVLQRIYHSLAITHPNRDTIDMTQTKHPANMVYGAGMVIRRSILNDLATEGWLRLIGRTGEKLTAGEDGEICYYVQKKGYCYGYNPRMIIEHDLSTGRLTFEYAQKLMRGIYEAVYAVSARDRKYLARRIKFACIIIHHKVQRLQKVDYSIKSELEKKLNDVYDDVMWYNLVKSKFIKR